MIKLAVLLLCCAVLSGCTMTLQGDNGLTVAGNSTSNVVTLALDGSVVRGVLTDSGNATGSDNWLSMLGAGNVTISASGSTITITCEGVASATYALDSDRLDGEHGSYYLSTTGTAADSTKFYGFTALQWTNAMDAIAAASTSADSDKLDGLHGSSYLTKVASSSGNATVSGSAVAIVGAGTASTSASGSTVTITGAGLSSKVVNYTRVLTAASGNVSYTGVGFQPTSLTVYCFISAKTTANSDASWGVSDSGKVSNCLNLGRGGIYYMQPTFLIVVSDTAGAYQGATLASYDADGFTLTWTKVGLPLATANLIVLAMK